MANPIAADPEPVSAARFGARLPLIAAGAVLGWFLISELATQAWYLFQEARHPVTSEWKVEWPAADDAYRRGFVDFQERPMTDSEKEILRYDSSHAASWRDAEGGQWSAFLLQWHRDPRLNQMDLIHNPTVCLAAAGLTLVGTLPEREHRLGGESVRFHGWKFERGGVPYFVFIGTRWNRDFAPFAYRQGGLQMRAGNLWRAVVGNRENPLQTMELVGVGFSSVAEAERGLDRQLQRLSTAP